MEMIRIPDQDSVLGEVWILYESRHYVNEGNFYAAIPEYMQAIDIQCLPLS